MQDGAFKNPFINTLDNTFNSFTHLTDSQIDISLANFNAFIQQDLNDVQEPESAVQSLSCSVSNISETVQDHVQESVEMTAQPVSENNHPAKNVFFSLPPRLQDVVETVEEKRPGRMLPGAQSEETNQSALSSDVNGEQGDDTIASVVTSVTDKQSDAVYEIQASDESGTHNESTGEIASESSEPSSDIVSPQPVTQSNNHYGVPKDQTPPKQTSIEPIVSSITSREPASLSLSNPTNTAATESSEQNKTEISSSSAPIINNPPGEEIERPAPRISIRLGPQKKTPRSKQQGGPVENSTSCPMVWNPRVTMVYDTDELNHRRNRVLGLPKIRQIRQRTIGYFSWNRKN